MEMGVCSGHGPEFGPKPKGVLGVLGKFFMLRISGQLPRSRFLDVQCILLPFRVRAHVARFGALKGLKVR